MKLLVFFLAFGWISNPPQDFYNLVIQDINDSTVHMSSFQGKNVVVAEFDASNPDLDFLSGLDNLEASDSGLVVLMVPATDFHGSLNSRQLQTLKSAIKGRNLVTETGMVSKSAGNAQLSLFKWLTNVSENTHFDTDVTAENQIFLISPKGELYAALGKATPIELVSSLLKKAP